MKSSLLWQDELRDKDNHPICIYDLTFTFDGNLLLVAADNKIHVYDIKNGSLIQTLRGHKETILAITLAFDGKRFATGSSDKQVIIWTSKLEAILKYSHNDSIRSLQYNPTSYQLLSCTNSDFGLWSPEQKNVTKVKVQGQINCCCWNEDGIIFALGFNCGIVSLRFKNGEEKTKIDRKMAVWGLLFFKPTTKINDDLNNNDNYDDDNNQDNDFGNDNDQVIKKSNSILIKNEENLSIVDWSKKISIYDLDGNQVQEERKLDYDPLFISCFKINQEKFFLIGGTNGLISLYTINGILLNNKILKQKKDSWIWCCKTNGNKLAIGCQNGNISIIEMKIMNVDYIYKELYAYRQSMTDVLIQNLNTKTKARIKCQDLVQKIAIYKTLLAIRLQKNNILLYEIDKTSKSTEDISELNYRMKEKITITTETETSEDVDISDYDDNHVNYLLLSDSNIILCQNNNNKLKSFNFDGKLEKEWKFSLNEKIIFIKLLGGYQKQESILLLLNTGQVFLIFLSKIIPMELMKFQNQNSSIKSIDLNITRKKLAAIDEQNNILVYDLFTKQLLYEEPMVSSLCWNMLHEDLLCFKSELGFIGVKIHGDVPTQTIDFSDKNVVVIGFSGNKIFTLHSNNNNNNNSNVDNTNTDNNVVLDGRKLRIEEISYSKLLWHFIQQNRFSDAYKIACLNVTLEDWQMLLNSSISKLELSIGRKCLWKLQSDFAYQELIYTHFYHQKFHNANKIGSGGDELFLAKFYAYQGLFFDAAKLFKRLNQSHLALEMFTDLQMYEQAKDYQQQQREHHQISTSSATSNRSFDLNENNFRQSNSAAIVAAAGRSASGNASNYNDLKTLSKMYITKGDHLKAFELIAKTDVNSIMAFVNQIDKGEIKLLNLIAEHFVRQSEYENAIQIYKKIGDFKSLAFTYIKNGQWEQALKIANDMPQLKQEIYFPYAMWLAENEKFAEAQQAFHESKRFKESHQVLNRLLLNSIDENRFNDAAYYSWLLANHFNQILNDQEIIDGNEQEMEEYENNSERLHQEAEIYYAYQYIYKYVEEPFTSVYAEILFNSALFLFQYIDGILPKGVSKVYILFALAKLGKTLGHYKLVRIVYKRLKMFKPPSKLMESIQTGSIEIRTKPFVDAEELSLFCYRCSSTCSLANSKLNRCINCNGQLIHSFYSFDILPLVEFQMKPTMPVDKFEMILLKNSEDVVDDIDEDDGSGGGGVGGDHDDVLVDDEDDDDDDGFSTSPPPPPPAAPLSSSSSMQVKNQNQHPSSRPSSLTTTSTNIMVNGPNSNNNGPQQQQQAEVYSNELNGMMEMNNPNQYSNHHQRYNNQSETNRSMMILNIGGEIDPETNLAVIRDKHFSRLNHSNVIITRDNINNRYRYYLNMMPEISIVACSNCNKFFYSDEYEFQLLKNGNCLFCRK